MPFQQLVYNVYFHFRYNKSGIPTCGIPLESYSCFRIAHLLWNRYLATKLKTPITVAVVVPNSVTSTVSDR